MALLQTQRTRRALGSLVTILLPVFNAGGSLAAAVRSITLQTYRQWELLVLDDGSTDGAIQRLAAEREPRIRVLGGRRNAGLAVRLNEGIESARGGYIARMDADDVAYPERLFSQVRFLENHPEIDLLGTRALVYTGNGRALGLFPFRATHEEICARPWSGFYLPHPTWMGRVEWFRRHRYAVPEVARAEDQELLLRSYSTSRFASLPDVLLGYRLTTMPIGRQLRARGRFAAMQWRVNLSADRPTHAALGVAAAVAKCLYVFGEAAMGGQAVSARGLESPLSDAMRARWNEVWREAVRG